MFIILEQESLFTEMTLDFYFGRAGSRSLWCQVRAILEEQQLEN